MDKANNIKDFRILFVNAIKLFLRQDNYCLNKNRFETISNDNLYSIAFNFYKRPTFIEIQTQSYYGNLRIEAALKENYSQYEYKNICGGDTRFICEYYFKQTYKHQYSNLIYDLDTPIDNIIQLWIDDYIRYIKPFLNDCSSPAILNQIVNEEKTETAGMNLTYKNRVLKSLFVALLSDKSQMQLIELSERYEKYLNKKQFPYLSDFLEIKQNVLSKKLTV